MTRNEKQGIQSVEQGMELLKVMATNGQPMMLRDLAAAVGMNPSSAHRYLTSFIRSGFVEQDPASGLYELGSYALTFSLAALRRLDHVRLAAPELSALCTSLGHTVLLAVWGNLGPTVVRWEEAAEPLTVNPCCRGAIVRPPRMGEEQRSHGARHAHLRDGLNGPTLLYLT
ncbi:MAG: helix-turn-helix domain-containing protein [Pseudomonadota bacterium]|jgi:DNA-binding IclR family transcriptional regulator